jgi:hypothetical protein
MIPLKIIPSGKKLEFSDIFSLFIMVAQANM